MDERAKPTVFRIGRAELKVCRNPSVIETIGLGSCVGIVLYDKIEKIGGVAHIMLPKREESREKSKNDLAKFADSAIEVMLRQMIRMGAKKHFIRAMIFGGADMFSEIKRRTLMAVGERNVNAVMEELAKRHITIIAQETGGTCGRTLVFNLADGTVRVRGVTGEERIYNGEARLKEELKWQNAS